MRDLVRTPARFVYVSQSWRMVSGMKRTKRGVISEWWRICWEYCSWATTCRLQHCDSHHRHNVAAVQRAGCMTIAAAWHTVTQNTHCTVTRQATLPFGQVSEKAFKAKAGYWTKPQSTNQDTYQTLSLNSDLTAGAKGKSQHTWKMFVTSQYFCKKGTSHKDQKL
jgi:hypothetical protein